MNRPTLAAIALSAALGSAQAAEPLQVKVNNGDANSFHVNSYQPALMATR